MYKKGARLGLRYTTTKGPLSIEMLWTLSTTFLAKVIKGLKAEMKKDNDDELSFLDESISPINEELSLKFEIVKDIYLTKKKEAEELRVAKDSKVELEKLLTIKSKRADEAVEKLSDEDLEKQIEALSKK